MNKIIYMTITLLLLSHINATDSLEMSKKEFDREYYLNDEDCKLTGLKGDKLTVLHDPTLSRSTCHLVSRSRLKCTTSNKKDNNVISEEAYLVGVDFKEGIATFIIGKSEIGNTIFNMDMRSMRFQWAQVNAVNSGLKIISKHCTGNITINK